MGPHLKSHIFEEENEAFMAKIEVSMEAKDVERSSKPSMSEG